MMEGAYFVGRVELLNWLNDLLKLDYTKVEQTCTAAAHCQIMDAIYPGQVPLHKVKFEAKQEYEYVNNFKVLQTVFDKMSIDKHIDVAKLVKGKYQDNLEFFQWIKRYFDLHYSGGEYGAVERRNQATKGSKTTSTNTTSIKKAQPTPASKPKLTSTPTTRSAPVKETVKVATAKVKAVQDPKESPSQSTRESIGESNQKIQELTQTVADLKLTIDGLEKERDFYFGKLREIEILCQSADPGAESFTKQVFKVLYATDESEGFVPQEGESESVAQQEQEEQVQPEEDLEAF